MNTFALKTTLSALLVAAPLSGAFADNVRGDAPAFLTPSVDQTYTSSIAPSSQELSYARQLDARIAAAQANLRPDRDGFVDQSTVARAHGELQSIRQSAAAEARANGGELSAASFQSLSAQVNALQQSVY
jgi:hypothetical protein